MIQPTLFESARGKACFSEDGLYRYWLQRYFGPEEGPLHRANFVLLNPSTADDVADDPTVRRCIDFAKRWGFESLCVTNLFAFRATDPKAMQAARDPIGSENDAWILQKAREADLVVIAWGNHGNWRGRGPWVRDVLVSRGVTPYYLTRTSSGEPGHPLYLRGDLKPVPWKETL